MASFMEHPKGPPSPYANEPLRNQLGPLGKRRTLVNSQGLELATYFWPARSPRAVVMLAHGRAGYVMEFLKTQGPGQPMVYAGSWVQQLNEASISVCGFDRQSEGFSQGETQHRSFFSCLDDVFAEAAHFRRSLDETDVPAFRCLPVFFMGVSLGGCVALHVVRDHPNLFSGAVLLAPMVSLEKVSKEGLNPYLLPVAALLSWLFPALPVASVTRNTVYPDLQRLWDEDPLNYRGKVRARTSTEFLRVTQELVPRLSEITFPWICFHGEADTQCDPDGSKLLLEKSQSKDKELVMLPKRWHRLVHEPGNEAVIAHIIQWISQRI